MRLIDSVHVTRFRSIRDATLDDVGDFSVLAGLNNAGKSNFLRALNLFFNHETEPGATVDVMRDTYRLSGKKIALRVEVSFRLPGTFRFRQDLKQVQTLMTTAPTIAKEWDRTGVRPTYFLNGSLNPADEDERAKIDQFLSLISYRYVPNRVLPLDLIRSEHAALRDVLIRRVAKSGAGGVTLFDELRNASEKLVDRVSKGLRAASADIDKIRLATPLNLADVIFAFGYQISEEGTEFPDAVQGSGLQSLLLLQTLALIDRDYSKQFGWKQAAIWGMEEPESSLHSSLEAEAANLLKELATEAAGRLQIVATTHSPLMIQYADAGWLVEKAAITGGRKATQPRRLDPLTLLQKSAEAGVSPWTDPLLHFPLQPVVIVEGKWDELFVRLGLALLGAGDVARVVYLSMLGEDGTGGNEEVKRYLKTHVRQIRARSPKAPVIVILDWEDASKRAGVEAIVPQPSPYKVLVWPDSAANPRLGPTFRGIERFYSDRLIDEAIERKAAIGVAASGELIPDVAKYEDTKKILGGLVQAQLLAEDLAFARRFLQSIVVAATS